MSKVNRITVIDVGHGNSAVAQSGGEVLVVDAGPKGPLLEFLDREKVSKIDTVILSHSDKDHIEGLIGILTSGRHTVDRLRMNPDASKDSELWADLTFAVDYLARSHEVDFGLSLVNTTKEEFGPGVFSVRVFGPSPSLAITGPGGKDRNGRTISSNSMSVVIGLFVGEDAQVLLTGDMDLISLDELEYCDADIRAPILVFPHHGGLAGSTDAEAFCRKVCEAVKPDLIVFSNGRGGHHNPRKEVVGAVRTHLPKAEIACTQLSEKCAITLPARTGFPLTVYGHGQSRSCSCAGSIVLNFDGRASLFSDRELHSKFVGKVVPTPLCR